jgi:ketosteroid isomerase-like protein
MADIKAEIIGLEKKWDGFYNTGDINSLIELYADDAVRYPSNQPALIGKEAIKKDMLLEEANKLKGATITSETVDVIGNENQVTETGNSIHKNAAGKVVSVSKYMTVWQKVDGKFVAVREMWNENVKSK